MRETNLNPIAIAAPKNIHGSALDKRWQKMTKRGIDKTAATVKPNIVISIPQSSAKKPLRQGPKVTITDHPVKIEPRDPKEPRIEIMQDLDMER